MSNDRLIGNTAYRNPLYTTVPIDELDGWSVSIWLWKSMCCCWRGQYNLLSTLVLCATRLCQHEVWQELGVMVIGSSDLYRWFLLLVVRAMDCVTLGRTQIQQCSEPMNGMRFTPIKFWSGLDACSPVADARTYSCNERCTMRNEYTHSTEGSNKVMQNLIF